MKDPQVFKDRFGTIEDFDFANLPTKISNSMITGTKISRTLKCDHCAPGKGCNSKWRRNASKTWKKNRDSQYRVKSV